MNYISFPTAQHAVDKIAQEFVIYSQLNHPVHISLTHHRPLSYYLKP